jgi:hypothetical protein
MTRIRFAVALLAVAVAVAGAACRKNEGSDTGTPTTDAVPGTDAMPGTDANVANCPGAIDVTADITADTTWLACNVYTLKNHIFVENAVLTVEAGTLVKGDMGSSLVITTTGRLEAVGTAAAPIVFTSSVAAGARASGDWGGLVLLGLATINVTGGTEMIEGFPATETRVMYGGTDDTHDCGTLQYVRVEFAGFELMPGNELNGISVGGCGSGTDLDFLQIHQGADDGIEFFGGTASVKHLIVSEPNDDGLDWDFGWTGNAQFVVVIQNATEGNNGFEGDDGPTAFDALPRSHPIIWNATLVGSNAAEGTAGMNQLGALLRRGTAGEITNMIMTHFADYDIDIRDDASVAQITSGDLTVTNSLFFDNGAVEPLNMGLPNDSGFDEVAWLTGEPTNIFGTDPMLTDELNLAAPSFMPMAGSPVLAAGAGATPPGGFFDATATYVGAFGTTDWSAGWTSYPPN